VITWTNERRKLSDLTPWERNPRQINEDAAKRLAESLEEFGQIQTIAIGPSGEILDGHQRRLVWSASEKFGPDYEIDVRVASRALTEKEREKLDRAYCGTVFVTFIQIGFGIVNRGLLEDIGFTREMIKKCPTIFSKNGWNYFKEWLALAGVRRIWHRSETRKHYLGFEIGLD